MVYLDIRYQMDLLVAWVYWPQRSGAQKGIKNRLTMAEEEFAANDVWFANQFRYTESQELEFIGDTSPGLELAEESAVDEVMCQASLVPLELPTVLPTAIPASEDVPTAALQEEVVDSAEEEDLALKPKAKRDYTSSYAIKMILASADLLKKI
jgi:hypothetical protein